MRKTARDAAQPVEALARRWDDLHAQGAELCELAGLSNETVAVDGVVLAAMLEDASEWQRNLAWQQIEDIDAMMQPGLTALRTIASRGQDILSPAQALWREFHAAREAVLHLIREGARQSA